jgi:hypothetical protein
MRLGSQRHGGRVGLGFQDGDVELQVGEKGFDGGQAHF